MKEIAMVDDYMYLEFEEAFDECPGRSLHHHGGRLKEARAKVDNSDPRRPSYGRRAWRPVRVAQCVLRAAPRASLPKRPRNDSEVTPLSGDPALDPRYTRE